MTTELWIEAFKRALGRRDESLDAHRIEEAFVLAVAKFADWPAPAQVIDLMPRRPEAERIEYEPPADGDTARKYFAICHRVIDGEITIAEANALFSGFEYSDEPEPF